jgi:hypothetical protein
MTTEHLMCGALPLLLGQFAGARIRLDRLPSPRALRQAAHFGIDGPNYLAVKRPSGVHGQQILAVARNHF